MNVLVTCSYLDDVNIDGIQIVEKDVWESGYKDYLDKIKQFFEGHFTRHYKSWVQAQEHYQQSAGKEFSHYDTKEIRSLLVQRGLSSADAEILSFESLKNYMNRGSSRFSIPLPTGFTVYFSSEESFVRLFKTTEITPEETKELKKLLNFGYKHTYGDCSIIQLIVRRGENITNLSGTPKSSKKKTLEDIKLEDFYKLRIEDMPQIRLDADMNQVARVRPRWTRATEVHAEPIEHTEEFNPDLDFWRVNDNEDDD